MIDSIYFPNPVQIPNAGQSPKAGQPVREGNKTSFAGVLDRKLASEGLKFSQHAAERLRTRGISLNENDLVKLQNAVDTVAQKGGKDSLVMLGDNAFVVNVKNRTVVTAIDKTAVQGNVFTNIDSAVIA